MPMTLTGLHALSVEMPTTVSTRAGHPVVFPAHGSRASYFRAGTRDRMWPDPNDEADGRGRVIYLRHDGDYGLVEPEP